MLLARAQIQPFTKWDLRLVHLVCRAYRVKIAPAKMVWNRLPRADYEDWREYNWDAWLVRFSGGKVGILYHGRAMTVRLIWTVIHELGHFMLDHPGGHLSPDGEYVRPSQWCEDEANDFAARVLLPCDEMAHFVNSRYGIRQIAEAKGVSIEAVTRRLELMEAI